VWKITAVGGHTPLHIPTDRRSIVRARVRWCLIPARWFSPLTGDTALVSSDAPPGSISFVPTSVAMSSAGPHAPELRRDDLGIRRSVRSHADRERGSGLTGGIGMAFASQETSFSTPNTWKDAWNKCGNTSRRFRPCGLDISRRFPVATPLPSDVFLISSSFASRSLLVTDLQSAFAPGTDRRAPRRHIPLVACVTLVVSPKEHHG